VRRCGSARARREQVRGTLPKPDGVSPQYFRRLPKAYFNADFLTSTSETFEQLQYKLSTSAWENSPYEFHRLRTGATHA
jgi:hypothetical protein